jgi:hypothetical protein
LTIQYCSICPLPCPLISYTPNRSFNLILTI